MFAACRSAGESAVRARIDDSRFGMCRAMPRLDPVGVALAELLRPVACADVDLAGCVALDPPRELLELDPEEALPFGCTRLVHRERLPHDDRGLRRQQPAVRLVHGPGDAVEPRRQVDDGRPTEPLVTLPPRRLGERVVDLHVRAPVAEARAPCPRSLRAARRRAASASRCRPRPLRRWSRRPRCARRR